MTCPRRRRSGYSLTWPLLLGPSHFPGYAVHPVVPAQQAEPGEAVKAVHREKCGAQVNYLFQWEKDAALNAIQTGELKHPFKGL